MSRTVLAVLLVIIQLLHVITAHRPNPLSHIHVERTIRADRTQFNQQIELQASPSELQYSGEWVTVSWSNVDNPSTEDWIGLYSPTGANYSATAPVAFQKLNESETHLSTGSGQLRFHLLNLRADSEFVFFRGGIKHPEVAAISNPVSFVHLNQPLHVHLALTPNVNEMSVSWVSASSKSPTVQWGTVSGQYTNQADAVTTTYTRDQMCGPPASTVGWREPGLLHTAIMTPLTSGTTYYYIVGDVDSDEWSDEFAFNGAPQVGANIPVNIIAYGDMGTAPDDGSEQDPEVETPSRNTTRLMQTDLSNGLVDVVCHIGDISYARGYSTDWDYFFEQIQPIAATVPYMVGIGNHERDYPGSGSLYPDATDSGGECGVPYLARFNMPPPVSTSTKVAWYSFNYGSVHFVFMSTEQDFSPSSSQYQFILNDLQNVDRTVTPWVIFTGHRPMYIDSTNDSPSTGDQTVAVLLRQYLEPLLNEYKVDLALWGHHHSYQRSCPVFNSTCQESGTVHVVVGMAGMGLCTNIEPSMPNWAVVVNDNEYGYTRIQVDGPTLTFTFISDVDGQVRDQFQLNH